MSIYEKTPCKCCRKKRVVALVDGARTWFRCYACGLNWFAYREGASS